MRKIKEVFRLNYEQKLSNRRIAKACHIARPTVGDYLNRAEAAGISWPLPEGMTESQIENALFPPTVNPALAHRVIPDWAQIHQELRHKHVTLFWLWQAYRAAHPNSDQYRWFCDHYRAWRGKLDGVMRQDHRAGEKLFVDYAGQTVPMVDPTTGEIKTAEIFVAVMGASNDTFAEATWTQRLSDWTGSHVRAFSYFGGVTELIVPDNLRSGVTKAHRYDPEVNPTCQDMANHYGVAMMPARAHKPRDQAKAENGVLVVERWILAA